MQPDFWLARWGENQIGFHEGAANTLLTAHAGILDGVQRVLVPLCGKAEDLAWLAGRGHQVVGIELADIAAQAFFAEHGLAPEVTTIGGLPALTAARVTIVVGDFFATTAAALGPLDGFYDRAAMIALPPPLRTRYVAHLRTLLAPAARGLLITFDYPPGAMDGPPFPVVPDDVHAAWAGATVVELAARAADSARLQAQGVTAIERAYAIAT